MRKESGKESSWFSQTDLQVPFESGEQLSRPDASRPAAGTDAAGPPRWLETNTKEQPLFRATIFPSVACPPRRSDVPLCAAALSFSVTHGNPLRPVRGEQDECVYCVLF